MNTCSLYHTHFHWKQSVKSVKLLWCSPTVCHTVAVPLISAPGKHFFMWAAAAAVNTMLILLGY